MRIERLSYSPGGGWSGPFPALDSPTTLVLVFGQASLKSDPGPIDEVARAYPKSQLLGCSSSTPISGGTALLEVTVIRFEHTTMTLVSGATMPGLDAHTLGKNIGKQLAKPSLVAMLVFADGLELDGGELVRGINGTVDRSVAVFGGLAGAEGTLGAWIVAGQRPKSGAVGVVALYGEHLAVSQSLGSGWKKVGSERKVTRADGHNVFEIDGAPALNVYEECAAQAGVAGPASPMTIAFAARATARHERSLVRGALALDTTKRAVRFGVDIPQGYLLQPMIAKREDVVASAGSAAVAVLATEPLVGKESLALVISHTARRLAAQTAGAEAAAIAQSLPQGDQSIALTGIYGLGEITSQGDAAELHNDMLALAMIMESPTPLPRKAAKGVAVGVTRPQAPASASGPAAHLRSRNPTVDDLFSEIEAESGKGPRIASVAKMAPPKRPSRSPIGEFEEETPPRGIKTPPRGIAPPPPPPRSRPSGAFQAPSVRPIAGMRVRPITYDESTGWAIPPGLDGPNTLVIAFGPTLARGAAEALVKALPASQVVGCSTDRALARNVVDGSEITASAITFGRSRMQVVTSEVAVGQGATQLAEKLGREPDLRAVLLFVDRSIISDDDLLVMSLRRSLPNVLIVGALTGGASSWLIGEGAVRSGVIVAVGLYGDHLSVSTAVTTGFEAFGPERRVSRAQGKTVFELDGKPAINLYLDQLGRASAKDALAFPVAVTLPGERNASTRIPVSVDQTTKSITFSSEVPLGAVLRLLRSDQEKLIDDVGTTVSRATTRRPTTDGQALALLVAGASRYAALGERSDEQVEAVVDSLPKELTAHVTGLYSSGEISQPAAGVAEIHGGSVMVAIIAESPVSISQAAAQRRSTRPPPPAIVEAAPISQAVRSTPPSKQKVITRPLLSGGSTSSDAMVTKTKVGDVTVVSVSGRVSESFKGDALARDLSGIVVFDLGKVERITSFGVREWLHMMTASQDRVKKVYFARCSEAIVNQLGMIRKFAGNGQVLSFFAPFLCDGCGEQFERLFDCENDTEILRSGSVPALVCPSCGGRARFDDDPETYFSFVSTHLGTPVPAAVRTLHDGLDTSSSSSAESVEKTVDGDVTRIRVQVKGASVVRWQRVLDGSEGAVVIDFAGLFTLDASNLSALEQALTTLSPDVTTLRLERCPQQLAERFAATGMPNKVVMTSTMLSAHCASCGVQRPALLVVDEHLASLAAGREPALVCRRCNGSLKLVDSEDVLSFLGKQRRQRLSAPPPPVRESYVPAMQSQPPPAAMSMPPAAPVPSVIVTAPMSSTRSTLALVFAGMAVLLTVGVAVFVVRRSLQPAPAATAAASKPAWLEPTDLPPAWVERGLVTEGDAMFIVGRCDRASSTESALQKTRVDAIARLVSQLSADLAGTPIRDVIGGRMREEDLGGRATAVADLYTRETGTAGQLERGETIIRPRDGGVEAFARYRIPRAAYTEVLAAYRRTATFHGVTIARAFPGLDFGASDGDTMIVTAPRVGDASVAFSGDMLLSANGQPFVFADFLKGGDEWFGVVPGAGLDIDLGRKGTKVRWTVKRGGMVAAFVPKGAPAAVAAPPAAVRSDPTPAPPAAVSKDVVPLPATRYREATPPATAYREPSSAPPKDREPPITTYKKVF